MTRQEQLRLRARARLRMGQQGSVTSDAAPSGAASQPIGPRLGDRPQYDPAYGSALETAIGPNKFVQKPPEQIGLGGEIAQGLKDPFVSMGQTMANIGYGSSSPLAGQANTLVADDERAYQGRREASGREGFDWGRMGGNVVSTSPLAAVAPGTSLLQMARSGAAVGGAAGGLQPVTDDTRDFASQKGFQIGSGAAIGGAFAPLVGLIGRFVKGGVATKEAQKMLDRGVTPTPGATTGGFPQIVEDQLQSVPLAGHMIQGAKRRGIQEFNEAAYNEALAPIGRRYTGPIGQSAMKEIRETIQDEYKTILPRLRFAGDDVFDAEYSTIKDLAQYMPDDKVRQFNRIIRDKVDKRIAPNNTMDGTTLKQLDSEMTKLLEKYKGARGDEGLLGDALAEVMETIDRTVRRSTPELVDRLNSIDKSWAMYHRLNKASVSAMTSPTAEGVFTPGQLLQAIRHGDTSAGKWRAGAGDALMQDFATAGQAVLGSKYPDSGSVGRALTGAGVLGGLALDPTIGIGLGLGAGAYTKPGTQALSALLTRRPDLARAIGLGIQRAAVPGALGASLLAGQ